MKPLVALSSAHSRPPVRALCGPRITSGGNPARRLSPGVTRGFRGDDRREIVVDWAMRNGNPSIPSRLDAMQQAGCDRILVRRDGQWEVEQLEIQ